MLVRPGNPDFLDLPWREPLAEWQSERFVEVTRGIHRHVVRFVSYGDSLYALKALPPRIARHEYRLLRELADEVVPVVEAVGVVTRSPAAGGLEPEAVLITRHLDFSLPYRSLFSGPGRRRSAQQPARRARRVARADPPDGLLLGRLLALEHALPARCRHALGLPRRCRDRRAAPAAEHGQRAHDLQIAEENVAGELLDLEAAAVGLPSGLDPIETAAEVPRRYEAPVVGADPRGRLRAGRDLPHRRAPAPPQRARLRRRARCGSSATPAAAACGSIPRSSSPGTTAGACTR